MFKSYEKITENRFRETNGLFYEEFEIGTIWEHRPGRTVTETDNMWGTMITMNQHPIHCDKYYAEKTEFGQILVNSVITFGIVTGMTVGSMSAQCIANLGWDKVRLLNPVYVGDTLYSESEIISKRFCKSRKNQGIVVIRTNGYNQRQQKVITLKRTFLVPLKDVPVEPGNG